MAEPTQSGEMPTVLVSKKGRLSAVWIAPVLAALAIGYMVYDALSSRGPLITITFDNAEGIVAGKSALKYEGVEIGRIEAVKVDVASGNVTLQGRLDATARDLATAGSQFWIQNPEIGAGGISSLDTLISGPYVACVPGGGSPQMEFKGLENRPPVPSSRPGLRISLVTDVVRELQPGSPVLFRGLTVGAIDGITLDATGEHVVVDVFIDTDHAYLVRPDSAFWEVSGLQADYQIGEGLIVNTDSIRPMLTGAIAFLSGPIVDKNARITDGTTFPLHLHPSLSWKPGGTQTPGSLGTFSKTIDHLTSLLREADDSDLIDSIIKAMNELRLASVEANRTLEGASRLVERDGNLDKTVAGLGSMAIKLQEAASEVTSVLNDVEQRQMLDKTDRLLTQLEAVAPDLVKAMADLGDTLERIDALVEANDQSIADTVRALREASLQLNALLEDLRVNPSQLLSEPPSRTLPRSKP